MSWKEFWNGTTTIYVNQRHKDVHYRRIAEDIVAVVPHPRARVLDFGCGEALSADLVAGSCGTLFLCDAAQSVRQAVAKRTAGLANVTVIEPEDLDHMPDRSLDVIVANSVIQYLSEQEFARWLATWRRLLSANGHLVLGDVVPRSVGPLVDATALLRFAGSNGFLFAAAKGLVRTALSDYRRKRQAFGLLQLEEAEIAQVMARAGFDAERAERNIGHNPARLTMIGRPAQRKSAPVVAPERSWSSLEGLQPVPT